MDLNFTACDGTKEINLLDSACPIVQAVPNDNWTDCNLANGATLYVISAFSLRLQRCYIYGCTSEFFSNSAEIPGSVMQLGSSKTLFHYLLLFP
jgi:hypothetical protein